MGQDKLNTNWENLSTGGNKVNTTEPNDKSINNHVQTDNSVWAWQ